MPYSFPLRESLAPVLRNATGALHMYAALEFEVLQEFRIALYASGPLILRRKVTLAGSDRFHFGTQEWTRSLFLNFFFSSAVHGKMSTHISRTRARRQKSAGQGRWNRDMKNGVAIVRVIKLRNCHQSRSYSTNYDWVIEKNYIVLPKIGLKWSSTQSSKRGSKIYSWSSDWYRLRITPVARLACTIRLFLPRLPLPNWVSIDEGRPETV